MSLQEEIVSIQEKTGINQLKFEHTYNLSCTFLNTLLQKTLHYQTPLRTFSHFHCVRICFL